MLLLDSGDTLFRGGVAAASEDPDQGAWVIEAMNAMGYDAIAMGNRELQALLPVVQARFEEALNLPPKAGHHVKGESDV